MTTARSAQNTALAVLSQLTSGFSGIVLLAIGLFAAWQPAQAFDGTGLRLNDATRWQARLQLNSLNDGPASNAGMRYSGSRLLSANLLGDYYLTSSGLTGVRGGLRATGGVLMGSDTLLHGHGLALDASTVQLGQHLSVGLRSLSGLSASQDINDPVSSTSYLGVGYSGQSLRGGWGFSADLGLISGTALGGLRLGSNNAQSVEDVLRNLRYKPVLQLGLTYSY
jgi:hypothetical protein